MKKKLRLLIQKVQETSNYRWHIACQLIAAKMLPKRVVAAAAARVLAHATTGLYKDEEVPAVSAIEALGRFQQDNKL